MGSALWGVMLHSTECIFDLAALNKTSEYLDWELIVLGISACPKRILSFKVDRGSIKWLSAPSFYVL
jgi:hypothetical protein